MKRDEHFGALQRIKLIDAGLTNSYRFFDFFRVFFVGSFPVIEL